jgi:hypothetical protein
MCAHAHTSHYAWVEISSYHALQHTSQQNGWSPLWMQRCAFRLLCWLNDLSHSLQLNGCSPLCIHWCDFRIPGWLIDLLHTLQLNGCSPLCMHWCDFRIPCWLNDVLHTLQPNGCSTLFMHRCVFRLPCWLNDLLHTLQLNGCSPQCMRWCDFSLPCWLNDLSHTLKAKWLLPTVYALMRFQTTLLTEWLLTHFASYMAAPHYVCVDVISDYSADWMTSYTLCKLNGCSPLCMRRCVFRLLCWLNVLLHTLQAKWLLPTMYALMWFLITLLTEWLLTHFAS